MKRTEAESPPRSAAFRVAELLEKRAAGGRPYHEFLRVPALSAGVYEIPAGGVDRQVPHLEDEVYYVIGGRGRFTVDGEDFAVEPGSVFYVAPEVEHRFHSIEEDLQVLVFFAPCETPPEAL